MPSLVQHTGLPIGLSQIKLQVLKTLSCLIVFHSLSLSRFCLFLCVCVCVCVCDDSSCSDSLALRANLLYLYISLALFISLLFFLCLLEASRCLAYWRGGLPALQGACFTAPSPFSRLPVNETPMYRHPPVGRKETDTLK